MAKNVLSTSIEATTATVRTATGIGWSALRFAGDAAKKRLPGYVSPEVLAGQSILKRFVYRFGVAGSLLDPVDSESELEERVAKVADLAVDRRFLDVDRAVELRPILPADALRDPALVARRSKVIQLLRSALAQDHDIPVVVSTHPIIPTEHDDSPTDTPRVWGAIAAELDGFSHQMVVPDVNLAMLGITRSQDMDRFFAPQVAAPMLGDVAPPDIMVLEQVGRLPEDNVMGRRLHSR